MNQSITDLNLHRLLKRQITKYFPDHLEDDAQFQKFFDAVNKAYLEFEKDLSRTENILDQSSSELFRANRELQRLALEKQAEASATAKQLSDIVNALSDAIIQLDNDLRFTFCNQSLCEMTTLKQGQIIGQSIADLFFKKNGHQDLDALKRGDINMVSITFLCTAKVNQRWLRIKLENQNNEKGERLGFIGFLADVTHEKQKEERISNLITWFDESTEAVQVCSAEGILEFVNKEGAYRLGKPTHELVGKHVGTIEKMFENHNNWLEHVEELKKVPKMVMQGTHKRPDGSTFPVEARVKYLEDEAGKGYVLAFLTDISERLAQQEKISKYLNELERINKELDQFAYVVSHDLKAPLRAINNLSLWIEEDLEDKLDAESRDQFDLLRKRVKRMENLITGILEYSRAGRMKAILESFGLKNCIESVCDQLKTSDKIHYIIAQDEQEIYSEKLALEQVLSNFISNAIKYNDKETILVEVGWQKSDKPGFIEIYVKDNGPGIEPEYHDRIFVIFQTLQARDEIESTGVGLAIVKKILDEKEATVRLESSLGEGSSFYFTWPINETQ